MIWGFNFFRNTLFYLLDKHFAHKCYVSPQFSFTQFNNEVGQTIYAIGIFFCFNGHEFEQAPGDGEGREPGVLQSKGSQRVELNWVSEQQLKTHHAFREVPRGKMK